MEGESKAVGVDDKQLFVAVLAAGAAARFGAPKQLAAIDGESLVRRAVRLAESVASRNSMLCTGNAWHDVFESASPLQGFLVMNEDYRAGMGSSIAAVIRALPRNTVAALLLLADQPLIETRDLEKLIDRWRQDCSRIVCSRFNETLGPPAIFPARYFDELAKLEGDRGARVLLKRHRDQVEEIDLAAAGSDVDTPDDLTAISAEMGQP